MKRWSPCSTPTSSSPSPANPSTPEIIDKTSTITFFTRRKRTKFVSCSTASEPVNPNNPSAIKQTLGRWKALDLGSSELSLPLTFPTGQTFRWKQTGPSQFTGVVKSHLVSLRSLRDGDIEYCFYHKKIEYGNAKTDLLDYLNAGICLSDMWKQFSVSDERFSELASRFYGVRVLRQDPLECLIQFLCSSNNNIGRITKMVDYISSLGDYLGTIEGFHFHRFPSLERLSKVSEDELRTAGFGYRSKYIVGAVQALISKPEGVDWLTSLRSCYLEDAIHALCTLPGVGPKVASCIALFSLDQHQAVPVDTHVWKIAGRYLLPEIAGARLTSKLSKLVAKAFVNKYGKYAGWAQTLLFVTELPSQKQGLSSVLKTQKGTGAAKFLRTSGHRCF